MVRNISYFQKHINNEKYSYAQRHMSHRHATILSNYTTFIIYGNFLDAFHLYQDIIKSVHYSQYANKEVSF